MKPTHLIAAIAAACAAVPAMAAPAAPPIPAPDNSKGSIDPASDTRRVCLVDEVTGSRLPVKTCRTRAHWIESTGVDPLAKR